MVDWHLERTVDLMNETKSSRTGNLYTLGKRAISLTLKVAEVAADKFDNLPVSPSKLADKALERFIERRSEAAAADSRWSEIERRRHREGGDHVILIGEDLTMADWATQRNIEESTTPDPWWLSSVRSLREAQLGSLVRSSRRAGQRLSRGWDETSTWDLGSSLTRQLADQLDHLAATSHGYPGTEEFPTFEAWSTALRTQAASLRRHDGSPEQEEASDRWFALVQDKRSTQDAIDKARDDRDRVEEADKAAAAGAMHWVADHLGHLWD